MKRILIIEDDSEFADLLKAELAESYQVELCQDGQSGYYAIYEYKPDAVLLDLTIEQMDAVSLVGKMRVQKQFQKLPIFVLADSKTAAKADDALAAGANEAFLKDESGTISSVLSAISELLKPSLVRKPLGKREPVKFTDEVLVPAAHTVAPASAEIRRENKAPSPVVPSPLMSSAPLRNPVVRGISPLEEESFDFASPTPLPTSQTQAFLDEYGPRAHTLRQDFIRYRTAAPEERGTHLEALLGKITTLSNEATQCGLAGLSRYLSVIDFRIHQLFDSNGSANRPSLQGVATALDVLAALSNHLTELEPLNHLQPRAMVVDDENVSRKALCLGLEKAKIKTTGVDSPDNALFEAEAKPFELIFLDVDLPKMNGFALCARMRIIPAHRKTPIIFVTSLNDVKSRASSRVSGGNDFLTKPVNLSEVGINSWSLIIGKRVLEGGPKQRA